MDRFELLRSLHVPGRPLVLPNAWDAASARTVAAAGFPVVATTSAGVAESLGFEDGHGAPAGEMLAAAERIVRAVDVPVTVDAEGGWGLDPDALAAGLSGLGASGCNLEDTDHATGRLREPGSQAEWLRAFRASCQLVVNARIDVFLRHAGGVPEALSRAEAYFEAGADCVYPIGLADRAAIAEFVEHAGGPVNILVTTQTPRLPELAELGVARVSFGGGLYRRTMEDFRRSLEQALPGA
jgi:2-methylisocitrate lyase-like PEP mutase family enzyme